jgi:hypothetical protein
MTPQVDQRLIVPIGVGTPRRLTGEMQASRQHVLHKRTRQAYRDVECDVGGGLKRFVEKCQS